MERYKKCKKSVNKSAHARNKRMAGMENLPLPDEIVLKILGYLDLGDLKKCARVSKRLNNICKDRSLRCIRLRYISSLPVMKKLTVKYQKSILAVLIDMPEVTEVILRNPSNSLETRNYRVRTEDPQEHKKAALHFRIFRKKQLVLQFFYLNLYTNNDPYLWTRL